MSRERPWYETFFGEDYLRIYDPFLPPERTAQEVDGIVRLLGAAGLAEGSAILDLACGHGRHAVPLAQRGYRVTGQDLSEVFLRRAEVHARAQGVDVRWVHGDMRHIPFEHEFDAVINIFTAFGYLESEEEDERVLREVHKALKPGGLFLLETMFREALMRQYQPHGISRRDDGLIVLEERRFDLLTNRNHVRVTLISPEGRRTEYTHAARIYTPAELVHMGAAAGLELAADYGGLDGSPLTLNSRRLVLVWRKPALTAAADPVLRRCQVGR
ncbi:MAG: class I SAM-dependent methyltransferase [Chloroflexi bacterium]|nr:class I SAM-dependent methyltransferase [Chloroflexota bacterium]